MYVLLVAREKLYLFGVKITRSSFYYSGISTYGSNFIIKSEGLCTTQLVNTNVI